MRRTSWPLTIVAVSVLWLACHVATPETRASGQGQELLARAKALELDTPYVPPPGDPLSHHAAGRDRGLVLAHELLQPAPIPEWQGEGDPRRAIRIADLLHMSSGLRIRAPQDPDFDPALGYPDHVYYYTGTVDSFRYAATRPLEWPPNSVGRYRNTDPVLVGYLIRLAVEKRGESYHAFPRRALFDPLGIRSLVMETDPFGNFLTQGYELGSGRDWARLGNLYLQDGVWNGERLLPEGFVEFVSTLAPAWKADGRPIYGGFFWLNGDGLFPAPKDLYYMAGAGGQYTLIVPSHELVVVRLGHYRGGGAGHEALSKALALLLEAVPARVR